MLINLNQIKDSITFSKWILINFDDWRFFNDKLKQIILQSICELINNDDFNINDILPVNNLIDFS